MIAKPAIPEADIRKAIEDINAGLASGEMTLETTRRFWKGERFNFEVMLKEWKAYRRQEIEKRACHQRPSVRRHITRRVKMPL